MRAGQHKNDTIKCYMINQKPNSNTKEVTFQQMHFWREMNARVK